MTLNLSNFAPALKTYYSNTRVENMVYKDHPFFGMLAKDEKFYGEDMPLPIIHGNPQGRSSTFSVAKANKGNSQLKKFRLTRAKDYSLASIDNETAEASENDAGAFLKALTVEIDGAMQSATNSMASSIFGDGSGTISTVSAISTDDITLDEVDDVVNFEIGMKIQFATSAVATPRTGTAEVEAVNRDTGVVSFVAGQLAALGGGGAAVSDFMFIEGDQGLKLKGLDAWLPEVAPTSGDNFFGVDRSVDPTRLAGVRFDGSSLPIEEALIDGAARLNREGGRPDICLLSYTKWAELEKALGSKVQYMVSQAFGRADIGFQGIAIKTNKGVVNVIADPFASSDAAFMLTMKSWKLYSLKKCIRILDLDGNRMLRESDADAVELRIGGYSQLGCNAPGHNARIKLS